MKTSEIIQKLLEINRFNHGICSAVHDLIYFNKESSPEKGIRLYRYIEDQVGSRYSFLPDAVLYSPKNSHLELFYSNGSPDLKKAMKHAIRLGFLIEAKRHFKSIGD